MRRRISIKNFSSFEAPFRAFGAIVAILIIHVGIRGWTEFDSSWDTIWYHLPFSLLHFHLTSFILSDSWPNLATRYLGMPPVSHWITGLLIWLSGSFRYASMLNFLGFVITTGLIKSLFGKRLSVLAFFATIAAFPVFWFHLPSGLNDLWTGCWLAVAFSACITLKEHYQKSAVVFAVAVFMAMGSKFQATPIAAVLLISFIAGTYFSKVPTLEKVFLVMLAVSAFSFWPAMNLMKFGNPTYPFKPPVISRFVSNYTETADGIIPWNAPKRFLRTPKEVLFWISALEINRLIKPKSSPFHWNIDAQNEPTYSLRLGGWAWYTVLAFLIFLVMVSTGTPGMVRDSARLVFCLFFIIMFVPQNHELRFWFVIPFALSITFALWFNENQHLQSRKRVFILIVTLLISFSTVWKIRHQIFRRAGNVSVLDIAPPEAKEFWKICKKDVEYCVYNKEPYSIFWAGPEFNTCHVKECADQHHDLNSE